MLIFADARGMMSLHSSRRAKSFDPPENLQIQGEWVRGEGLFPPMLYIWLCPYGRNHILI